MQQLLNWAGDRLCYTQQSNNRIDTAWLGHTNKEKLNAWCEWLHDKVRSVRPSFEGRTGYKHEIKITFFGKGGDVIDQLAKLDLASSPPRGEATRVPLHGEKCAVFFPGDRVCDRGGVRPVFFTITGTRDSEGRWPVKLNDGGDEHWRFPSAAWNLQLDYTVEKLRECAK